MCVKFKKSSREIAYKTEEPLELQLVGASEVFVDYKPRDPSITKFVKEMERMTKQGLDEYPQITVRHNNHITGARIKKKIEKISNDITLNKLMKLMAKSHYETDKKLEEMVNICIDRK